MNARGYSHAYPHLGETEMPEQPTFHLESGYVKRGRHVHPKSGTRRPWKVSHNFLSDVLSQRFGRIEDAMVFGRAPAEEREQLTAPHSASG